MNHKAVFDPKLGLQGGSRYRDPETGHFVSMSGILMFRCPFCKAEKPVTGSVLVKRLFPPVPACRDCREQVT